MQNTDKPWVAILVGGLVSTVVTLAVVHLINRIIPDFYLMGWYIYHLVPIGAMLVGMVAGSGYYVVAWKLGIRPSKAVLIYIVLLQVVAFIAAEYFDYLNFLQTLKERFSNLTDIASSRFTFLGYLDLSARSMVLGTPGAVRHTPLNALGYGVRLLEAGGFCLGGMLLSAALSSSPYCERCQRFIETKTLALIPAAPAPDLMNQIDQNLAISMVKGAIAQVRSLHQLATEGKANEFRDQMMAIKQRSDEANKAATKYAIQITYCPVCKEGHWRYSSISIRGHSTIHMYIEGCDRVPVSGDFVNTIL